MEEFNQVLERSEIALADTWALEDIYPTDEAWEQDLARMKALTEELARYAGKIARDPQALLAYLQKTETMVELLEDLGNYAQRKNDQDTRVSKYQDMTGRFMSAYVAFGAAVSFETPELLSLSDADMDRFYREAPELEAYRRYLEDARRRKAHVLSPAEEKLLAAAGEMADAPDNIYGLFTNADLTFPDAVDGQGNKRPLSAGTFVGYEASPDRALRKDAYEKVYTTLGSFQNTAAALLSAQVKQLQFFSTARRYPSSLDASLDATNVPTSVYLNLIEAVHKNMDKMHRYVTLRKKLLGVDELHFYDIYTPLVADADKKIPFAEAKKTVYEALAPMGDGYRKILQEGFDHRWIDVYQNVGKRGGAYSAGALAHPYVLLNYHGTLDDQFTLAHEMGHALHSYFSNHTQRPIDRDYVIFVAEVASTCNEALLMEHLLSKTTDRRQRAYLINHFLEQFKGTLYRQTMFAEFELNIGRMAQAGQTLTAETLNAEYRRLNELYFGPDMVVDDLIAKEWIRIPHFYYNYYVFQYATGYSAAIALSRRILREGESAVKDYIGFLSGGCSKSPIELLKGAGVDMTSPAPVEQALELFGTLLDEMESLMAE